MKMILTILLKKKENNVLDPSSRDSLFVLFLNVCWNNVTNMKDGSIEERESIEETNHVAKRDSIVSRKENGKWRDYIQEG